MVIPPASLLMIPRFICPRSTAHAGSALVIVLLMIVVLTVLILTMTVQSQLERKLSAGHLADQQARSMAQLGFDTALGRIRETLAPFDDPFGPTARPTNFWSISPGRIDLFDFTADAAGRPNRSRYVPLHSGYPVTDTNDAANLNAPDSTGHRPIWAEPRKMEVDWMPVGNDPAQPVSSTNPIAGRFAFWVDDEGSKVNVNTADGSDNYTLSSYGQGTPTAVSLGVFHDLGDAEAPDLDAVRAIAADARRQPFASLSEMALRDSLTNSTKVVSSKFPATNAFNLTTYSRSPDFNIFNLPKFQLIPSNVPSLAAMAGVNIGGNPFVPVNRMVQYYRFQWYYNSPGGPNSAVSALSSLYPGRNQLSGSWTNVYPLMPAYAILRGGGGNDAEYPLAGYPYQLLSSSAKRSTNGGTFTDIQTSRFAAMAQMERYLVGTNALGDPITWPFRDPNYLAKYNLRQLDSITLQFFEMARAVNVGAGYLGPADSGGGNLNGIQGPGIAPYGILGDQPVMSAVGRYPRLTRVLAQFNLQQRPNVKRETGAGPAYEDANGDGVINSDDEVYYDGANLRSSIAFTLYLPRHLYDSDNHVGNTLFDTSFWGVKPFGWKDTTDAQQADGLNEMDWVSGGGSLLNPTSRWMDTLFYAEIRDPVTGDWLPGNSSGIDFCANNPNVADPDPRAPLMRRPTYKTGAVPVVWGTGYSTNGTFPLLQYEIFGPNPACMGPAPGLMQNFAANQAAHPSGAGGPRNKIFRTRNIVNGPINEIRLRGGLTMRLFVGNQAFVRGLSPMENIAGPIFGGSSNPLALTRTSLANQAEVDSWRASATNRVVPIFGRDGLVVPLNQTQYLVAKVRDPLVSMLPGDWVVKASSTPPGTNATGNPAIFTIWPRNDYTYSQTADTTTFDFLPEPEWVDMAADSGALNMLLGQPTAAVSSSGSILEPYLENGQQQVQETAAGGVSVNRVMNLSKQLSFPSVGRLQYVRTGAMPDNENAVSGDDDYAGMPFRLLNFGPENTQGGIPDWAMLDLYMVPNAIWTTPASRFAYPAISATETNRPTLIHLTYGGASTGKMNLNGSVLWPWAETDAAFIRTMPLAAQFNGLRYNQDGKVERTWQYGGNVNWNTPGLKVITSTNSWEVMNAASAETLAGAIAAYIRQRGPLSMPGQMCDIPAVNAYGAQIPTTLNGESLLPPNAGFYGPGIPSPDGYNRTRNDIVSQSLGNLTTQGNVFSVWVVGQTIKKSLGSLSSKPNTYERELGDKITGESRMRFIVERKLNPGLDGVYGNTAPRVGAAPAPAGLDGTVGTPDDLVDGNNHPPNPKFIYQVLSASEIH